MGPVTIGLDVGQRIDPTAVAVAEAEHRTEDGRTEVHYVIRFLERLPLGTPYPKVAERVAEIVNGVRALTDATPLLSVDATGVGTPLVDSLRAAQVRATIVAVYFTHGDRRTAEGTERVVLGKAWLVSRLQVLLQAGLLHLPKSEESEALAQELLDYEIHVDENANDKYGAFKVGTHDDLVTALGLAVQGDTGRWSGWAEYLRRELARGRVTEPV